MTNNTNTANNTNVKTLELPAKIDVKSTCGEFLASVPVTKELVLWAIPYALGVAGQRIASGAKPEDQRLARKELFAAFADGHVPSTKKSKKLKETDPYNVSVLQAVLLDVASQMGFSLTRLGSRENPKSSKEQFEHFAEVTGHDVRLKPEALDQLIREEEAAREKRRLRASFF